MTRGTGPDQSPIPDATGLVGTWRLRSWISAREDGDRLPMGEKPEGLLVYTADGCMITTIGRAARPPIEGDLLQGPAEQRLAAFASFIAYSGTFRMDGPDVIHDVTMSLFPNWVGTSQRRHVAHSADGSTLELSSDPFVLDGSSSVQRLLWERLR